MTIDPELSPYLSCKEIILGWRLWEPQKLCFCQLVKKTIKYRKNWESLNFHSLKKNWTNNNDFRKSVLRSSFSIPKQRAGFKKFRKLTWQSIKRNYRPTSARCKKSDTKFGPINKKWSGSSSRNRKRKNVLTRGFTKTKSCNKLKLTKKNVTNGVQNQTGAAAAWAV